MTRAVCSREVFFRPRNPELARSRLSRAGDSPAGPSRNWASRTRRPTDQTLGPRTPRTVPTPVSAVRWMGHHPTLQSQESLFTKGTRGNLPGLGSFPRPADPRHLAVAARLQTTLVTDRAVAAPHARSGSGDSGLTLFGRSTLRATAPSVDSRLRRVGRTIPGPISVRKLRHRLFRSLKILGTTFPLANFATPWRNRRSLTQPKPNPIADQGARGLLSTPVGRTPNSPDRDRKRPCVRGLRVTPEQGRSGEVVLGDRDVHSKDDPRGG